MFDFKSLKNSKTLNELKSKIQNEEKKGFSEDERLWKLTFDKSGQAMAVIRFLPSPPGEESPWIKEFSHSFQVNDKWYIEKSLNTIDQDDPVGNLNRELWNSGTEQAKAQARRQGRRTNYYSNIYVVKDPSNPENEGKVFLFKYNKHIFDKLKYAIEPAFEEDAFDPFNPWTGANFKMVVSTDKIEINGKKVNVPNYDRCTFDSCKPLLDDDDEIVAILNKMYSLKELISEDKFKTYAELEKRLNFVLGKKVASDESYPSEYQEKSSNSEKSYYKGGSDDKSSESDTASKKVSEEFSSDSDSISYFASLAEED